MTDWREQPGDWLAMKGSSSNSIVNQAANVFKGHAQPLNEPGGRYTSPSPSQSNQSSSRPPLQRRLSQSAMDAVDIAEGIVTNLMSLLDALQEVASGVELSASSPHRKTIQAAAQSLPNQLNRLLAVPASSSRPGTSQGPSRQQSFSSATTSQSKVLSHQASISSMAPVQEQQYNPDPYAGLDETERRLRAEKERQERIKRGVRESRGKPPPNFNLMSSKLEPRRQSMSQQQQQQYQEPQQQQQPAAPASGSGSQLGWKEALKLKKQQERMAAEQAEYRQQEYEENKYAHLPQWKAALLKEKERKKWEAERPQREAEARQKEKDAYFNSLPAWKQQLLIKKGVF